MIDWKKVASDRARELKRRDANRKVLRLQLQHDLRWALFTRLHARCVGQASEMADEISVSVASRIVEGL